MGRRERAIGVMDRTALKNERLRAKLDAIRKEMDRLDGDIRDLNRAVSHPERQSAIRRLRQVDESLRRREEAALEAPQPVGDARPDVSDQTAAAAPGVGAADSGDLQAPRMSPDQRFASYFVTGSLHSVRPLRTERRIQRNKALLMLFFAALVLYGVISLLLKR